MQVSLTKAELGDYTAFIKNLMAAIPPNPAPAAPSPILGKLIDGVHITTDLTLSADLTGVGTIIVNKPVGTNKTLTTKVTITP